MSKRQHHAPKPVPSQPVAAPGAVADKSADQPDRGGRTQSIDQDVGDSLGGPRPTEGGIESLPPRGEPI